MRSAPTKLLPVLQRKLRESEFFIIKMEDRAAQPIGNYEEFDFYLSAFLSATRSITDQLSRNHKAWFARWRASRNERENRLIDFMCKQRIAEVHFSGADVSTTWREESLADLSLPGVRWFGSGIPTVGIPTHKFELGEVLPVCREFLSVLGELVRAFESAPEGSRG
jgi:hypothetical protein